MDVNVPMLVGAALHIVAAGLYAYVGSIMLQRETSGSARRAMVMFATWWFALGSMQALSAFRIGLFASGIDSLDVFKTLSIVGVLPLVVALWGLLYYLLYLHTGKEGIFWPLTLGYGLLYVYFVYLVVWLNPTAVEFRNFTVLLVNERQLAGAQLQAVMVLLLGPVATASILYGSLFFRLKERMHRYRIGLVSVSFFIWVGVFPVLGIVTGLNKSEWWPLASRALGLLVPILIIAAYRPPAWVQRRLGEPALTGA